VLPADLIQIAKDLANSSRGKPKQAHLRRAMSTIYYSMFHTLAQCCADMLIGGAGSKSAWKQVYRALDHGPAKNACNNQAMMAKFPKHIQDFANMFWQTQVKRHDADYDPTKKFTKSEVVNDINAIEVTIINFENAAAKDKRAFSALVLFRERKS
jgi:uncharacterized protein (UPF0332 family)